MSFFDINHIAFEVLNYPISYIELIGTLFGLISVYLASKANILTWATGIVNEFFLLLLFFQIQLYADMFLQVFFFIVTVFGWYYWKNKPKISEISRMTKQMKSVFVLLIISGTILLGFLFNSIHLLLPDYFKIPAAFPFSDSFVMVTSVLATFLLAKKKLETWYLWLMVDVVCVFMFFKKGILFLGIEYIIFLGMALYGLMHWKKLMRHE